MIGKGEAHSTGTLDVDAELARLATLSLVAYERERLAAAERLGMRAPVLDTVVKQRRAVDTGSGGQGQELKLHVPDPWHEIVDGAQLLSEVTAAVRRYVVMEDGAAEAVALWVLHAHALDAFAISPRLGITSPEKRCGKTTCLDVVARLVPRPLPTANIRPATVFRIVEKAHPTLLVDEADTFLDKHDEMRGILNSGHRRSNAFVARLVGEDHEPRLFSTWAASAVADQTRRLRISGQIVPLISMSSLEWRCGGLPTTCQCLPARTPLCRPRSPIGRLITGGPCWPSRMRPAASGPPAPAGLPRK